MNTELAECVDLSEELKERIIAIYGPVVEASTDPEFANDYAELLRKMDYVHDYMESLAYM